MKYGLPAAQIIAMAQVKKPAAIFFKAEKFSPMYLKKGYIYVHVNRQDFNRKRSDVQEYRRWE